MYNMYIPKSFHNNGTMICQHAHDGDTDNNDNHDDDGDDDDGGG